MKRVLITTALAAALLMLEGALTTRAAAQGDAEQGRQLGYTCLGCHGIPGYRNAYPSYRVPKLGGQKAAYLKAALRAYRDGMRPHPTMQAQGSSLSDQDIDDLVAWITPGEPASDELDAASQGLPEVAKACVNCHGSAGEEMTPAPPVLSGQHSSYLEQALGQYKANARGNNVMNSFAAPLSMGDMKQLAQFYASRAGLTVLEDAE